MIAGDMKMEKDDFTMSVFRDIANSVNTSIEVEVDFPSNNDDKFMPILDMKFDVNEKNKVVYKFFKKPKANKFTMMANSALSDRVKRSTITKEANRRLLCCSSNLDKEVKIGVMKDFARTLKRSGYSERFRHEAISDAVRGHQKMVEIEAPSGRPADPPKEFHSQERRRGREEKRERYYRKKPRGTSVRDGVFIVPPTPNNLLAKELTRICQEELRGSNISMTVQERGGRRLGQELGVTVPGKSKKEHCLRVNCFPCNSGQEGICRKTGPGYHIDCLICGKEGIESPYAGETGKNLYMRGVDYIKDVANNKANKHLWKHILEKYGGHYGSPYIFSLQNYIGPILCQTTASEGQ